MKVKIKRLRPDAIIPRYSKPGDAGLDLTAVANNMDLRGNHVYYTGLAFEIPEGHVGLLFPRSSISNTNLFSRTAVSVIDSGYRGEVTFKFGSDGGSVRYKVGDRIGQLIIMPYPTIEFEEVEHLSETERGEGSYGSTGN